MDKNKTTRDFKPMTEAKMLATTGGNIWKKLEEGFFHKNGLKKP